MLGGQRRLEGAIARPRVAAQYFHARFQSRTLEGIAQLGQVVLAAQLLRIAGVVLLASIFKRIADAVEATIQTQTCGFAGQGAERSGGCSGDVVQSQQIAVGGGRQLR